VALYVSGSIAAYKACAVVTGLRKHGVDVRVAMTRAATRFVTPMTLQSLSGNSVAASLWQDAGEPSDGDDGHGMAHIALSQWAEVQVAAPASADLIARLALGLANDTVTATALACPAPLVVAPAMESGMWRHQSTQDHVATLARRGAQILWPGSGRLASGAEGPGRMAEPEDVVAAVLGVLDPSAAAPADSGPDRWLAGKRVVVTAGGTREPIDAVRFVGNRSSGKMGNALAGEALCLGAQVTLVTAAAPPAATAGLTVVSTETAEEMLGAVRANLDGAAVLVMAAAVADYRPVAPVSNKIKKGDAPLTLELAPTTDVLRALRDDPSRKGVTVVGFAAETDDLHANARRKLEEKGLDLIVANDVGAEGIGMGADDNAVVIIGPQGVVAEVPRAPKPVVASAILETIRPLVEGQ
jgi:phosphopantothenoylcysteine decarboxylase/phosphopantothenate--cysteine ligase